ncbi:MAG: flavin monoamine oxidase family protein [Blastocatellia bacterium]
MDRRRFLAQAAGSMVGLGAAVPRVRAQTTAPARVLVIGAGLSGLTAARVLQDRGDDVVVIEGRDRIGGRIWTSNSWEGLPVDLGASWIHGVKGNPLSALALQTRTRQVPTSYNRSRTYHTSGRPLTRMEESSLSNYSRVLYRAIERARMTGTDTSIRQVANQLIDQYRSAPEARSYLNHVLNSEIEHEYSGSASSLSNRWYDDDREYSGGDVLLSPGYGALTGHLAEDLRIEFNQTVQEIDWSGLPVRVKTDKEEFSADRVLVTLPLGVLQSRSVRFAPALPFALQNSIDRLGMGVLNKCVLRFATVFWPTDLDWIGYLPEQHGEWAEWFSCRRTLNQPVLVGFNAADRGREIESLTDAEIVESALATLRTIYGSQIPTPVDYQITRWASDPFARGSYSFNALGSVPLMRDELARPRSGRLFFAGEATHRQFFGTAHGAYLSGQRAANEIIASLPR